MDAQNIIGFGAIIAALIAGYLSYLNLIISKEQKISEFRQRWIDEVRADLSQFIAAINYIAGANDSWEKDKSPQKTPWHHHWYSLQPAYDRAGKSFNAILLRLNPDDKKLKNINSIFIMKLTEARDSIRSGSYSVTRPLTDELVSLAKPILKEEWRRVKSGEPSYRMARRIAATLLITGFIMFVVSTGLSTGKSLIRMKRISEADHQAALAARPASAPRPAVRSIP